MHEMTLNSGAVVSVSAATKKQIANAEILFGKNAKLIIKKIDELVKIKELDTSKLDAILDILNDADATTAFAKKAAGKSVVTAMKNLYKAKTLIAVINGLRAIKIKATDPHKVTKAATPAKVSMQKTNKSTDAVPGWKPMYAVVGYQHAREYAQDFIRSVEPVAGAGVLLKTTKKAFEFTYKKLHIAVTLNRRGWKMVYTADHLPKPRPTQIHIGELQSIRNVIELINKKAASDSELEAAARKGMRKF